MKQAAQWESRLTSIILPLAFVGPGFLNMLTFILGLHANNTLRQIVVIGIQGIATLFLFFRIVLLYWKSPSIRRFLHRMFLILAVFVLIYLWAFLSRTNKILIMKNAIVNGCYLFFAWSALILIIVEKRLRSFLLTCRIYAWILSPIVLYYCIRFYLPSAEWGIQRLGLLASMPLAYTLFEFCLFFMMEAFLYGGNSQEMRSKFFLFQDMLLFVLFSIAIILAATKGVIICLLVGTTLLVVYSYMVKRFCKRYLYFPIIAILALLIFAFLSPPNYIGGDRVVSFIDELGGDTAFISLDDVDLAIEIIHRVEATASTSKWARDDASIAKENMIVEYVKSGKASNAFAAGLISQEEYDLLIRVKTALNNTHMSGRIVLWNRALQEIKTSPLYGHGPFYYQEKYGTYPHNFFLELAADFGLPVTLLILFLGLYVFNRLIRFSLENSIIGMVLLYVFSFLFRSMVSSNLYSFTTFFQYGGCILLAFYVIPKHAPILKEKGHPDVLPQNTKK